MRRNPAATDAKLGEQMCKLVAKGAIDFSWMMAQLGIQSDQFIAIISAPGAGFQAWIPSDANFIGQTVCAIASQ
ncbi:MAG: hypothetical protein ABI925_07320 [Verrucomicrobiota bacterium]